MEHGKDYSKQRKKIGQYILMDVIGKGEFGIVHSAVSTEDNQKYAQKETQIPYPIHNEGFFGCIVVVVVLKPKSYQ